jgi:ABC-type lipoprotein release transport system permease subunit
VACGVAAGTAVLVGALLVGDSMRGSLRDLTLDRLGRVDEVLLSDRFFRAELADELAADPRFQRHFAAAVPAIRLRASIQWPVDTDGSTTPARANRVNVYACDGRFWRLGPGGPKTPPAGREIILNRPLADRLRVEVGDKLTGVTEGEAVSLQLPQLGFIPAESLLGQKSDTVERQRLTVREIIPAAGLGRFSLRPNQQLPLNAYVPLALGRRLFPRSFSADGDRVNAILVAGNRVEGHPTDERHESLQQLLEPKLADYGIRVEETPLGYYNVTSDRMLLGPATGAAIRQALGDQHAQPAMTYLANTIALGERKIPYSMITAVDFSSEKPLGPFHTPDGKTVAPLRNGQITLNDWAAEDLGAKVGDTIRVSYFKPESTHGAMEESHEDLELAAVVALAGAARDPHFTPQVAGVTEKDSIRSWEAPFEPFHPEWIRIPDHPGPGNDEDYWDRHGTTPKAFVSLSTGRRLWESRFGQTTSVRVAPTGGTSVESFKQSLEKKLRPNATSLGFLFQPVKRQGLDAAVGTTSFGGLFLGFSFFIIAAAVMLVALLFRLGIDGRAEQVGILAAVGFSRRKVALLLAAEGLVIAALGSLVGTAAGAGYAAVMLFGLRTWWVKAVVTPFLHFHGETVSYVVGYASGVLVALVAIVWAVWATRRTTTRSLLAGQVGPEGASVESRSRVARPLAWAMLGAAVALLWASRLGGIAQAGAFFGAGSMVLVAALALSWARLRRGAVGTAVAVGRGNLVRMAVRSLARNPGRSTLTIGLVASASFLIVSVSAFRIDPSGQTPTLGSGNGGFALVVESDLPIQHDLNDPEGRAKAGMPPTDAEALEGVATYALRVRSGDDASCLNLYKPREPRILGVPQRLTRRGGFTLKPWEDLSQPEVDNPWLLLARDLGRDEDGVPLVPALVDAATATYSLHLSPGSPTLDVATDRGQAVRVRVVGVLPGSIFQGDLLIGEEAFLEYFPEAGYRFFLMETTPDETDKVQKTLQRALSDYGLAVETTGDRLARFLVVQNTYLSTFQSLGGLGLLLGTFGLGAVQLRNVLERRRELALLRAFGFRRRRLAWLVLLENGLLLVAGLACGLAAASIAVLPHLLGGGAGVPWLSLGGTLALVLCAGMLAGLLAVGAVLTAPLLPALRGE